ncbi:hypothetical protein H4J02_00290 [Protaetiibacter sp. SSC-01]|uniref:hypothetical protein n=1 Tax=Protaetiibacter sp. SSC-01 TaxID=2759943 RepID=UPI00165744CE|nr:hypothetical protein [Protaetiibacter sp. SSC-01]QNO37531.1 hypothetical protein H4J02_00290 [Protaetiibacter sp. SSC-01]
MLKKFLATFVAVLLTLGLSLVATSPAVAASDGRPSPGKGSSDHRSGDNRYGGSNDGTKSSTPPKQTQAPAPAPAPTPAKLSPAPAPSPTKSTPPAQQKSTGPSTQRKSTTSTPQKSSTSTKSTTPTKLYGVAIYVYKKLDPTKDASWSNSGPQKLLLQDVDNTSKETNTWYTSLDPALLGDICGPGWAVQQDKVSFTGSFSFPSAITPPADNIGWPPLYDAKHQNLEKLVQVPTCAPPPAPCIDTSAVSYTYDAATNSGVITVAPRDGSNGRLCKPFYVTATSWKYLTAAAWPQKLDQVQKLGPISEPGSYPYSAPVTCGQGDIYASWSADDPTLDPTPYLYGPDSPFDEKFLHDMGFTGTKPTYMNTQFGCNVLTVDVPSTPPSCEADGGYTLPEVEHVTWHVGGAAVEPGDYTARAGDEVAITAVADETWVLKGGKKDKTSNLWTLTWTLDFPEPECEQARAVVPKFEWENLSCDAEAGGSYTLPDISGVTWLVDGLQADPDTYTVTGPRTVNVQAVPDQSNGPVVFPGDAKTTWTLKFTASSDCLTLTGSSVTGTCEADSPWIHYTVTLTDPYDQSTTRDARLILAANGESVTLDLGTIPDGATTLTGKVLWPGASVDPDTGAANGWPGWELVGGEWRPTPGNYAWTRVITDATLEVNPSLVVSLTYPPATPDCDTQPPQDPPTLGSFPTNAQLAEQCTADGRAVLTLGLLDGVSFFEDVNYFIDGVPAASSTVALSPGTYRVTVTVKNPSDGLDGPTAWNVTVRGGDVCGELETLALTGFDGGYLVALAAMMLAAGAAILVTGRRQREAD